jgi:cell division protein ZapE
VLSFIEQDMTNYTPFDLYQQKIAAHTLKPDALQRRAAERLSVLAEELEGYEPADGLRAWLAKLLPLQRNRQVPPQGLYLWGDVGRGKSMLMDLFFETAPCPKKRRVHFHAFMLEIHQRLHEERQKEDKDPIPAIVDAVRDTCWLLCFDEFHVTNIVDAMLLQRLFTALWDAGLVTVATSNWHPSNLYQNGLQRDVFLPFIDTLCQRLEVVELNGDEDYRQQAGDARADNWFFPDDAAALTCLNDFFDQEASGDVGKTVDFTTTEGRTLRIPRAAPGVAWFAFTDLCDANLGVADYLSLAQHYPAVCLAHVPVLAADDSNRVKRFMLLIDALYEAKTRVALTAAVGSPTELYTDGVLAFEFARTASRLQEMRFGLQITQTRG